MRSLALGLLIAGIVAAQAAAQSAPDGQPKGPFFGPPRSAQTAAPLYLQADQLIYETGNTRVVARGSVELYFDNRIVTADELIYEQAPARLTLVGNALVKAPDGAVTRADRIELPGDVVEAFAAWLKADATERRFAVPPPK